MSRQKRCPCKNIILADTEEWNTPICCTCYEDINCPVEEPPKLVKKWLWAYPEHHILAVTAGFMSDDEAVKYFDRSTKYIRTNVFIEVPYDQ